MASEDIGEIGAMNQLVVLSLDREKPRLVGRTFCSTLGPEKLQLPIWTLAKWRRSRNAIRAAALLVTDVNRMRCLHLIYYTSIISKQ